MKKIINISLLIFFLTSCTDNNKKEIAEKQTDTKIDLLTPINQVKFKREGNWVDSTLNIIPYSTTDKKEGFNFQHPFLSAFSE
ncbi:MAG: hypothetical protein KBG47_07350 [Bacteroidia bacterium]|nr:hypothetical protein [Bacteroidia bacterium]